MSGPPRSTHAEYELEYTIAEAEVHLDAITIELQRYKSLTKVHYGHVGDVKKLTSDLWEAFVFISGHGS